MICVKNILTVALWIFELHWLTGSTLERSAIYESNILWPYVILIENTSQESWSIWINWSLLWWLVCQKQVSRAGTSNYTPQLLWDVITCTCPWYLLLARKSSNPPRKISRNTINPTRARSYRIYSISFSDYIWFITICFGKHTKFTDVTRRLRIRIAGSKHLIHWGWTHLIYATQTLLNRN